MNPRANNPAKVIPTFLSGVAIVVALLLPLVAARAQYAMPHEELMRRARGPDGANAPTNSAAIANTVVVTNDAASLQPAAATPPSPAAPSQPQPAVSIALSPAAPLVVATPPAQPAFSEVPPPNRVVATPVLAPLAKSAKSKEPVFSEPPADLFLPASPVAASPSVAGAPASAVSVAAAIPTSTNAMDALDDKHRLAIGDRLSFRIVEDEEDPRALLVTDSGDLEVPYIGRFPAVGKSCKELALALKAELEKEYYFQATVVLAVDAMARSRGKVYLVGPVRMPGPQEIPSDEVLTLSKAILRAGGFNDFADKKNVKVTRKSTTGADETYMVDVSEILERGRTAADLTLLPGDLIYIQERLIRF